MNFRFVACLLMVLLTTGIALSAGYGSTCYYSPLKLAEPLKVSPCQLKNDPGFYNHKQVEVTGFVSHGFEDFSLMDPACSSWFDIWLEYGGTTASGTMYCCGVTAARSRPHQLIVEDIPITLVDDERFRMFDKLIQRQPDSVVRATIVGRFFAGEKITSPTGVSWGGYGHMGCCSLLAIEKIASVDPHASRDLDYGAAPDQPDLDKIGCGNYRFLIGTKLFENVLKGQAVADSGQAEWSFTDPKRVATEGLAKLLKINPNSIKLTETRKTQGRLIYDWHPRGKQQSYMVVVSRPYWLSFYAKDPKKVAWVVLAAYESCS